MLRTYNLQFFSFFSPCQLADLESHFHIRHQCNSIQEPWLVVNTSVQEKPSNVLVPILQKLNQFETDAPHSWDEVSEALEDLKPALNKKRPIATPPPSQKPYTTPTQVAETSQEKKQEPRNSVSIHTLEELEAKLAPKPGKGREACAEVGPTELIRRVHLVERDSVVLYTTSLRGVRETFESCARVKTLFEVLHVIFDERDVSLHGECLNELRDLTGEVVGVPRVFIKGRYIGGGDEFVELNESGRLGRILVWARVDRVEGRHACEGRGDARLI
ncbi:hypothetical protein DKX38_000639 [Salix brachista]|uniref:Glutaredoxin domain-containing protein n=1 Tax=Salix brachista TaxID=2182728 RepID=A0A5N5P1A7_9ROSI|nr:hypothetical protein DKX38_000639 [Salix brachista]